MVALLLLQGGLLGIHIAPDLLDRRVEGLVIGIHRHLGEDRGHGFIDPSPHQLRADRVLQIVPDVALAHGRAHGHRRHAVAVMLLSKFVHRRMDHPHLRGVPMGDRHLPAILDKIRDDLRRLRHCRLLLRKVRPQRVMPQSHYNTFLCHIRSSLFLDPIRSWYTKAGPDLPPFASPFQVPFKPPLKVGSNWINLRPDRSDCRTYMFI